jgi:hypothetical protein
MEAIWPVSVTTSSVGSAYAATSVQRRLLKAISAAISKTRIAETVCLADEAPAYTRTNAISSQLPVPGFRALYFILECALISGAGAVWLASPRVLRTALLPWGAGTLLGFIRASRNALVGGLRAG